MPACAPLRLMAEYPSELSLMATSAHDLSSPVERSTSNSRLSGLSDTSPASSINSSVVSPIALTTATTLLPFFLARAMRPATLFIFFASARELPPYF